MIPFPVIRPVAPSTNLPDARPRDWWPLHLPDFFQCVPWRPILKALTVEPEDRSVSRLERGMLSWEIAVLVVHFSSLPQGRAPYRVFG